MSAAPPRRPPGTYKFTVKSTDEAVALIRDQLGPAARVLSVRALPVRGLRRFFSAPRIEVVAQLDGPSRPLVTSDEVAAPTTPGATTPAPASRLTPLPSTVRLTGLLRRSGITETALHRLQAGANWSEINALPLHRALAETSRLLLTQAGSRAARPVISRAAFLGAAGVGRTTALCKWLAADVVRRARLGHVVTVEFDRPNAPGPLPVFTEALGVPLARFPCATHSMLVNGFVYCDLPALSVRRPSANATLAAWLDREAITERVLVLNAAYERAALRAAYAAGRDLGATHLVFTHLDEVPQWGRLWDYLFDESIEPLFLSTGPSLTGECEEDVAGAIMRRTLPDDDESPAS